MQGATFLTNHDSQSLTANTRDGSIKSSGEPIFVLCDKCYWCATYLVTLEYMRIIIVHNAMQTAIN